VQAQGPDLLSAGPVQKKMWGPSTGAADPIFLGKKLATFFCSSLAVHSGIAHFSDIQKFAAPFVGGGFLWGPCSAEHANHA